MTSFILFTALGDPLLEIGGPRDQPEQQQESHLQSISQLGRVVASACLSSPNSPFVQLKLNQSPKRIGAFHFPISDSSDATAIAVFVSDDADDDGDDGPSIDSALIWNSLAILARAWTLLDDGAAAKKVAEMSADTHKEENYNTHEIMADPVVDEKHHTVDHLSDDVAAFPFLLRCVESSVCKEMPMLMAQNDPAIDPKGAAVALVSSHSMDSSSSSCCCWMHYFADSNLQPFSRRLLDAVEKDPSALGPFAMTASIHLPKQQRIVFVKVKHTSPLPVKR